MYSIIVHHKDSDVNLDEFMGAHVKVPYVIKPPTHPLEWLLLDDDMGVTPTGLMFSAYAHEPQPEEGVLIFILDPVSHDFINQFTRKRAREAIIDRLLAFRGHEDPIRTLWRGRDVPVEEVYWSWLAYGLIAEGTTDDISYHVTTWGDKQIPVLHYATSQVFYGYIRGFLDGREQRREELRGQLQLIKE